MRFSFLNCDLYLNNDISELGAHSGLEPAFFQALVHAFGRYCDIKNLSPTNQQFLCSLKFHNSEEMRELNLQYRNLDKPTDVLSFPVHDHLEEELQTNNELKSLPEVDFGDIIICFPIAVEQAKELNHDLKEELRFLFFHGLAHLLGHNHEIGAQEEKAMQEVEKQMYFLLP